MAKKEKYSCEQLIDYCNQEISIDCSKCSHGEIQHGLDEYEASESFFKDGWRVTPNHCYCPDCAQKYLKL